MSCDKTDASQCPTWVPTSGTAGELVILPASPPDSYLAKLFRGKTFRVMDDQLYMVDPGPPPRKESQVPICPRLFH